VVKVLSGDGVNVKSPKIRIDGKELYNPLFFYPFNTSGKPDSSISMPYGIVHGDLNAMNILFYKLPVYVRNSLEMSSITAEIPCIIDYAHTGERYYFTDIAKMECTLKFKLLNIDNLPLQFEAENILSSVIMPSAKPKVNDANLQKVFNCIYALREIAADIIKRREVDESGYWMQLYIYSLSHLKYTDLKNIQKRYAFISAALILTNHLIEGGKSE